MSERKEGRGKGKGKKKDRGSSKKPAPAEGDRSPGECSAPAQSSFSFGAVASPSRVRLSTVLLAMPPWCPLRWLVLSLLGVALHLDTHALRLARGATVPACTLPDFVDVLCSLAQPSTSSSAAEPNPGVGPACGSGGWVRACPGAERLCVGRVCPLARKVGTGRGNGEPGRLCECLATGWSRKGPRGQLSVGVVFWAERKRCRVAVCAYVPLDSLLL